MHPVIYLVVCGFDNSHGLFLSFLADGLLSLSGVPLLELLDHPFKGDLHLGGDIRIGDQVLIEDLVVTALRVCVLHLIHVGQQLLEQVDVPDCYR